jgi:hypothetical protein
VVLRTGDVDVDVLVAVGPAVDDPPRPSKNRCRVGVSFQPSMLPNGPVIVLAICEASLDTACELRKRWYAHWN